MKVKTLRNERSKRTFTGLFVVFIQFFIFSSSNGQDVQNCFLEDFEPKIAEIPPSIQALQPMAEPTVTVTVNPADTLCAVSRYIFGASVAVWTGSLNDKALWNHLQLLSPALIRYPGGSWADIFFWNGKSADVPDSLYNASTGKTERLWPQYGMNSWPMTLNNYYSIRGQAGSQGLITVNYGYARYGTGPDPVAQAAHYAADWVRNDNGRTLFWEVGNENGGPWEAGWQIDTSQNQDGQPQIITGELYGKHFKVFADSMRKAADEIGATIYIGVQILHFDGTGSWNVADRTWNAGVLKEAGHAADFYVVHNYFSAKGVASAKGYFNGATAVTDMMTFMRRDIIQKGAALRPIALTEWNISGSTPNLQTSVVDGMQAAMIFGELINNGYGMSSRWLIAGDGNRIFNENSKPGVPKWNPYPDFFYMYYMQKYFGDHAVTASVSGSKDVVAYASVFGSGHASVMLANKGSSEQTVRINLDPYRYGGRYYVYSLTGGTDNGEFSQQVFVNGTAPDYDEGGPIGELENLEALSYPSEKGVTISSPKLSMQFILIEGSATVFVDEMPQVPTAFDLRQNYPNPFNPMTTISYSIPTVSNVCLTVYDMLGRELAVLVNEQKTPGIYNATFDGRQFASGIYFYRLQAGSRIMKQKMVMIK
jgi:hypothetical protein